MDINTTREIPRMGCLMAKEPYAIAAAEFLSKSNLKWRTTKEDFSRAFSKAKESCSF